MLPAQSCTSAVSSRSLSNSRSDSFPIIPDYHGVGWVKSAHGIRGEVFIRLAAGKADWLGNTKSLLLVAPDSSQKSCTFQFVRPHKDGLIVKFREITDRNQAESVCKFKVYLSESAMVSHPGEPIFLNQIKNFTVIDQANEAKAIGVITGFASNGPQDLLKVDCQGKEALIPFVEAFIVNIDFDKKELTMDLPRGLVDVDEE